MKDATVVFMSGVLLVLAVIGLMTLLRKRLPSALTDQQQNTMLGPFAFITTLYAFLLGFVVVTLWHTFNDANRITCSEAESVGILYRLAEGLPGGTTVQDSLLEYLTSVREDEWPAMAAGIASKKTEAIFERIWKTGRSLAPESNREQLLYARFVGELTELSRYRKERLLLNGGGMPDLMWWPLCAGAILLLAGLYFLSISGTKVQILVDCMVVGMMLLMIYLAIEFNGPFEGDVKVLPKAFEMIENNLRHPD
jgi:hypothetical protein